MMSKILVLLTFFAIGCHAAKEEKMIDSIISRKLSGGKNKARRRVKKSTYSPTASPTTSFPPSAAPTTATPTATPTIGDMELAKSLLEENYDLTYAQGEYPFWFYQINCKYHHDEVFGIDYKVEPKDPIEAAFHGGSQQCDIINWKLETVGTVIDTCKPIGGYMFDCSKKAYLTGGSSSYSMGIVDLGSNIGDDRRKNRKLQSSDDLNYEFVMAGGTGALFNSGGTIGIYPIYGEDVDEIFILKVVGGPGVEAAAMGHWTGLREHLASEMN